jgi:hypothetical protein
VICRWRLHRPAGHTQRGDCPSASRRPVRQRSLFRDDFAERVLRRRARRRLRGDCRCRTFPRAWSRARTCKCSCPSSAPARRGAAAHAPACASPSRRRARWTACAHARDPHRRRAGACRCDAPTDADRPAGMLAMMPVGALAPAATNSASTSPTAALEPRKPAPLPHRLLDQMKRPPEGGLSNCRR